MDRNPSIERFLATPATDPRAPDETARGTRAALLEHVTRILEIVGIRADGNRRRTRETSCLRPHDFTVPTHGPHELSLAADLTRSPSCWL